MAAKKSATKLKTAAKATRKPVPARATTKNARRTAAKITPLLIAQLSPSLTVNDVETSLGWYLDVLGFQLMERWERDGKLMGAGLAAGETFLMLGQDDWKKGRNRIKGQGVRMYCETDQNIDVLAAGIKARGGVLTQEPMDQMWGMRDFAIEDPDGYKITIAKELKKNKKR